MLLEAQHLSMTFGEETVLQDISLKIDAGQSLALWGSSGSGKSTLLALLGLILSPTAGTILIEDNDCSELGESSLARIRRTSIGFVFQHTQLVSSLRALDNVLLPINLMKPEERRVLLERLGNAEERARQLLVEFGLERRIYHYPHQLSVGQKRRIALARAFIADAPLILADEPTNDLDAKNAQVVEELLIKAAREHNKAVVLATHDSALAAQADELLVMGAGCVR